MTDTRLKIGILGAGSIGATAAALFIKAGHSIAISNSRGPDSLTELVAELGPEATAETAEGAARFGDIILEAIPFGRYRDLPAAAARGKIVMNAANYYVNRDGTMDLGDLTQSELVAGHLDGARVVKAFNTIYYIHLRDQGDLAKPLPERRVIPLAGDDDEAKQVVAGLIEAIGFAPLDMGGLRDGGRQMEPGQPIYNKDITLTQARELLGGQ
ncbi:MAG: NAD(P)-binding domain-containing protein [Myxococcota bacterium]